jgi:di/tricarboxylate transporter
MTTPIGNPQNLYLYSRYNLSLGDFFSAMLPLTAGAALLLVIFLLLTPSKPLVMLPIDSEAPAADTKRRLYIMYGALFLLCLCAVAKILSVWAAAGIVFAAVFFYDQRTLRSVDYNLLLTFVGFFLFVGNLGALPVFRIAYDFKSVLRVEQRGKPHPDDRMVVGYQYLCGVHFRSSPVMSGCSTS